MMCDEVKPLLNGHLDGEIEGARASAIDAHLSTCKACAEAFDRLKSVRDAVRTGVRFHRAPAGLDDRIRFALRGAEYLDGASRRTYGRLWMGVAAGIALAALTATTFFMISGNHRDLLAYELVSAHERALMRNPIDVVSSDQHTVKPWFNGKVPFSPPVTDFATQGYPLEGGRVDYAAGQPVAVLVYKRRLHRIDVFVWPGSGATPPSHFERDGYNEIGWAKNDFSFTAVSDLNPAELKEFAALLRSQ